MPGRVNAFQLIPLALAVAAIAPPAPANWCRIGQLVMVPDGREGPVTALDGELCHVLVYGEKYVSHWAYYLIEPVDPPASTPRRFGH